MRAALAPLLTLLVLAGPAQAATVSLNVQGVPSIPSGTLTFTAARGEANRVTLTDRSRGDSLAYNVRDAGATLTAGPGCARQADGSVSCSASEQSITSRVTLMLGDGDDRLDMRSGQGASVDGGTGADVITGSPGTDDIHGGSGRDRIAAGGGDDFVDGRDDASVACGAGRDVQVTPSGARAGSSCETATDTGFGTRVRMRPTVRAGVATFKVACSPTCKALRIDLAGYGRSAATRVRTARSVRVPLRRIPRRGAIVRLRAAGVDVRIRWP
jgi:hypothetical protein